MNDFEKLLDCIRKNDFKLTIRYEKEYGTFLLKMKDGDSEAYRHIYPDDVKKIVPIILDEMLLDISLDKEEGLDRLWGQS